MGVKIVVGSDLGGYSYPPGASVLEFATLVEAGMTPMQAIQAGTRVAAEMLMRDDQLGTLEPGKLADVIAVAGDPSQDIRALQNVRFVMVGGRLVRLPDHEGGRTGELAGLLPAYPSGSN
jgi:imidazolonepropionase-like amidohydrolase